MNLNKLDAVEKLINSENCIDIDYVDADGNTMLIDVCKEHTEIEKRIKVVKAFIEAGGNVNHQNNFGETALMIAVLKEEIEISKILISAGADVNMQNKYGMRALTIAIRKNKPQLVQILIEAGAEVNYHEECFLCWKTPLMIAV
jgi:ankyrin repeat protein